MRFDLRSNFREDLFPSVLVEKRAQDAGHEHENSRDTTRT
jgi:hypothetical protein